MANTFEALAVVVIAVLPGGAYVWAVERQLGAWGSGASDRAMRLVGTSAVFHVFVAPLSYWLWSEVIRRGTLARGERLSWLYWLVPGAYVGIPWALGTLLGWMCGRRRLPRPFDRVLLPRSPRAWDHLWCDPTLRGWVRVRLKSGGWLVGAFGAKFKGGPTAHASRYPEAGDLWLAPAVALDDRGEPRAQTQVPPRGVLVRWEEVDYLEFQPGRKRVRRTNERTL